MNPPESRPRLVATDIDGTIVPAGGTLSRRTRAALEQCVDNGMSVVLVTGRPPRWLGPVAEAIDLPGAIIASNGSILLDSRSLAPLRVATIAAGVAAEVVRIVREVAPQAAFAAETVDVLRAGPGYENARRHRPAPSGGLVPTRRAVIHTDSDEAMLATDTLTKLVALDPHADPDRLLDQTRDAVGHLVSVTRSVTGQALIEFGPDGVTKATALSDYAASLGITADEVIAFGDMPNDVEMLRWAGRGYAMTGAHPDATAAAPFLAPPAEQDGVAQVLEAVLAGEAAGS